MFATCEIEEITRIETPSQIPTMRNGRSSAGSTRSSKHICRVVFTTVIYFLGLFTTGYATSVISRSEQRSVVGRVIRNAHPFLQKEKYGGGFSAIRTEGSTNKEDLGYSRRLSSGDFDEVNALIAEWRIRLPDQDIDNVDLPWPLKSMDVSIRNLICYELTIGNIDVVFSRVSDQKVTVQISVTEIFMNCDVDWSYTYDGGFILGWVSGSGTGTIEASDSDVEVSMDVTSVDFRRFGAAAVSQEYCNVDIIISDATFKGGISGTIANIFEKTIKTSIATEIQTVACQKLSDLADSTISDGLLSISEMFERYMRELPVGVGDPIYAQESLVVTEGIEMVDLLESNDDGSIGDLFRVMLGWAGKFLGGAMDDPRDKVDKDLGINIILRAMLLDDNGIYTIPMLNTSEIVLYQDKNNFTETTITMNSLHLKGLDSLSKFDPFNTITAQTIQNHARWESLEVEMDLTVDVLPSSNPDSVIKIASGGKKNITVNLGMDDIETTLSLLIAVNSEKLGNLRFSSILNLEDITPCVLSTLEEISLTQLHVSFGNIHPPNIDGFVSDGINRVMTTMNEGVFDIYKEVALTALPNIFNTLIREVMNDALDEYIQTYSQTCPTGRDSDDGTWIDFRDLFLIPEEAIQLGASGNAPYGTGAYKFMDIVKEQLTSSDPIDNTPKVNKLIRGFTNASGSIFFSGDLLNISSSALSGFGIDSMELRLSNTRVENIDSVGYPFKILQPLDEKPFTLDNALTIGTDLEPLRGASQLSFSVKGGDDFWIHNEMDLTVSVNLIQLFVSLYVKMKERSFLEFPLRDVMNWNCWLASLGTEQINELGDEDQNELLTGIEDFVVYFGNMTFGADCSDCNSGGVEELPRIVSILQSSGTIREISSRIKHILEELATGEFTQSHLRHMIQAAPYLCPHCQIDDGTTAPPPVSIIKSLFNTSIIKNDGLELLVLGGFVFAQVVAVVAAKSFPLYVNDAHNPLSAETSLVVPKDVELLNLDDLNSIIGSWFPPLLDRANDYLGGITEDDDLGINIILRSALLDSDGALTIPVNKAMQKATLTLAFEKVRIFGLDTITDIDAIDIIGRQTLQSKFHWKKIKIEIHLATINSVSGEFVHDDDVLSRYKKNASTESETAVISIELTNVKVVAAVLMALDRQTLGDMHLGSVLHVANLLPCVLSAAYAVNLPELFVTVGGLEFSTTDAVSDHVNDLILEASRAIHEEYGDAMTESIPSVVDSFLRPVLDHALKSYIRDATCPASDQAKEDGYIDYRDLFWSQERAAESDAFGNAPYGDIFRLVKETLINQLLSPSSDDGTPRINQLVIRPMTLSQSNTSGVFEFSGDLIAQEMDISIADFESKFTLRVSDVRVENLDSLGYPIRLLEPNAGYAHILDNTATMGTGTKPLRAVATVLIALESDDFRMRNELNLSLEMQEMEILASLLAKINERAFMEFPLRDVLNWNCWLAAIPAPLLNGAGVRGDDGSDITAALSKLEMFIKKVLVGVDCVSCTSEEFNDLSDHFSSPQGVEDATNLANKIVTYFSDLLQSGYTQVQIDRMLGDAEKKCPHHSSYGDKIPDYSAFETPSFSDGSIEYMKLVGFAAIGFFLLITVVILTARCLASIKEKRWVKSLSEERMFRIHQEQAQNREREKAMALFTKPMATSDVVPLPVRIIMPFVILGNIALFLSGHLNVGASVSIFVHIGGQDMLIENFFTFSMAQSTLDMWNAGAQELAILILIFSGVWPYTKQIVTLVLWFMPPTWISAGRRGSVFVWLDTLAKWSMIDIFVLVMSLVAFRVTIPSPDILPQGLYEVNLIVIPLWGLYANLIAQLVSQISSHFIIHYHRRIVSDGVKQFHHDSIDVSEEAHEANLPQDIGSSFFNKNDQVKSLRHHAFEPDVYGDSHGRIEIRAWVGPAVMASFAAVMILIIIGCVLPTFQMELLGLVGLAVESGQQFQQAVTDYSIFSIVRLVMDQAKFINTAPSYVGLGSLAILFLFTLSAVPLIQCAVLAWIWWVPMTKQSRKRALTGIEILKAWQYVEVYIIAILITAWQIGEISSFMINDYCDALNQTFAALTFYGVLSEPDAQCFLITAKIKGAAYVLVIASALLVILSHLVTKAATQMIHEDNQNAQRAWQGKQILQSGNESVGNEESTTELSSTKLKIEPVPVLFTDQYRWIFKQSVPSDVDIDSASSNLDVDIDSASSNSDVPISNPCPGVQTGVV